MKFFFFWLIEIIFWWCLFLTVASLFSCCKKKNKMEEDDGGEEKKEPEEQQNKSSQKKIMTANSKADFRQKDVIIQVPKKHQMAKTNDPNYQTLTGLNNEQIFQTKGGPIGGSIKNPTGKNRVRVVRTNDPRYQTLVGLGPDVFGPNKKREPKPPARCGQMARTTDPNYYTLAGLANDQIFQPKGNSGGELQIKAPAQNKMIRTNDPNYQTLVGLTNDDIFKPKNTPNKPSQKSADHRAVDINDSNYMHLAAVNGIYFGADKKNDRYGDDNRFLTY